jgi:hypothetical protein
MRRIKKEVHSYHRFVKTTPNPRATKNSRGEFWVPLFCAGAVGDGVAEGAELVGIIEDMLTTKEVDVQSK